MPNRDIVVVGASAGGVEALKSLVSQLPADLPATVLVTVHVPASSRSVLPDILARARTLRAVHATDGAALERGTVLVAPPDFHLLVHDGRVRLSRGPRENGHRPAVDPLFRSAARWYGTRVIGVVLSGALDDGTNGMLAVRARGGVSVAHDPADALYPSMPLSVIERVGADHVAAIDEMGALIDRLVRETVNAVPPEVPAMAEAETEDEDMAPEMGTAPTGPASAFTCPECHGALWELQDGELARYRCRVGHAFAPDSLMAYQGGHVEEALWTAYRALEEARALAERLAEKATRAGLSDVARRYAEKQEDAKLRAEVIRRVLVSDPGRELRGDSADASNGNGTWSER